MMNPAQPRWYHELTRYHWFVLSVAALGWMFDTMDQQLFTLARVPAMNELLAPSPGTPADPKDVGFYGPLATAIFLIGWASGGLDLACWATASAGRKPCSGRSSSIRCAPV